MIMAGGTGGHIFPALAVAERLRVAGHEVFWLGSSQGLETKLVPEYRFPLEVLPIAGIRSTSITRKLQAPGQMARALFKASKIIKERRPKVALGMGGFAAGPGGLIAWKHKIPLVIHEQNSIPGMTNRWLSRLATKIYQAFPDSFPASKNAQVCGNPVRQEIIDLPDPKQRWQGRGTSPLRLLILGGSQGAKILNETVPKALTLLPNNLNIQIRHQTGTATLELAQEAYKSHGIDAQVMPFIHNMAEAYGWADLAIARAGALTLAELAAAGLGSLLIPFPYAVDDHQTHNAAWLVKAQAAHLLPQNTLTAESLAQALQPYTQDRTQALKLAQAAREQAQTTATETIAEACTELATIKKHLF